MENVFFYCALVGGTILVCQFVLTLLGMGDADSEFHTGGHDVGHGGLAHDGGAHDASASHDGVIGPDPGAHHDSTWLFGVITFRTMIAAVTFFGLGGMIASEAQFETPVVYLLAISAGVAAMFGVYYMMRALTKFDADGTLRIERAIGNPGTVYIPIPGNKTGVGKIQIKVQERLVELQAMTPHDRLPTGANVTVTGVLGPDTVEVAALHESEIPVNA